MGLNCGCLFSDCCDYIVYLHRQEDAETHVGDIWSDSGADGCRLAADRSGLRCQRAGRCDSIADA